MDVLRSVSAGGDQTASKDETNEKVSWQAHTLNKLAVLSTIGVHTLYTVAKQQPSIRAVNMHVTKTTQGTCPPLSVQPRVHRTIIIAPNKPKFIPLFTAWFRAHVQGALKAQ